MTKPSKGDMRAWKELAARAQDEFDRGEIPPEALESLMKVYNEIERQFNAEDDSDSPSTEG